ncbi:MAG: SGNH/GDSL hydrolase family protein [Candidatus Hydrogenedentes bacterium]|nr:SGNH/GDSL hydrolase family protein [Candidatus Hydrogenedentota bacterium]
MKNISSVKNKIFWCFYLLLLLPIWSLMLGLAAELSYRLLLRGATFLYQPLFEYQTRKVYGMAPPDERGSNNLKNFANSSNANWVFPNYTSSSNASCKEEFNLALEGIVEALFDKEGRLLRIRGDPILRNHLVNLFHDKEPNFSSTEWREIVRVVTNKEDLPFIIRVRYDYFYAHHYDIKVEESYNGLILTAKEIKDNYPFSLQSSNPAVGADSPWLVPFYAYKTNWKIEGTIAQYNNFGFRDDDIIVPKPEGVVRIVCIGGSTTEEGNSNYATYPNIMERKLKGYFNTDKIDVVNAGICGIRSFGELRRIWDYLALQPDLILYYNAVNDICYHYIPQWVKMPNPYKKWLASSALLNFIFNAKNLPSEEYIANYFRENIFTHLGAMNCACKSKGAEMAVCSFAYPTLKWYELVAKLYCDFNIRNVWISTENPITFRTYTKVIDIYNSELRKFCEEENILYIPVAEEFKASMDHFFDICHMTPLGLDVKTDIIGSYVARWLEKRGLKR